jgi:hypothetical protein
MAVEIDIVEGNRGRIEVDGGASIKLEYERIAVVHGLAGTPSFRLNDAVFECAATESDRLYVGAVHPTDSTAICDGIEFESEADDVVRLRFMYHTPAEAVIGAIDATIEVGASVVQETVNRYPSGALIVFTYNGKPWAPTLQKFVPQTTITETAWQYGSPGNEAKAIVGTVNNGATSFDPMAASRQWLCTGITGASRDGGKSYQVKRSYQFRDTWDEEVVFTDDTGRVPKDAVVGNGIQLVQLYEEGF